MVLNVLKAIVVLALLSIVVCITHCELPLEDLNERVSAEDQVTPFTLKLPNSFGVGGNISFVGIPKCNPKSISFWLLDGPDVHASIAPLHVRIDFREDKKDNFITLGSRYFQKPPVLFRQIEPMVPKEAVTKYEIEPVGFFYMDIVVGNKTFQITFNDKLALGYEHHMIGVEYLKYIYVEEDVWIVEMDSQMP